MGNRSRNDFAEGGLIHIDMDKASGIYKITCTPTQKYYYGSSEDIHKRWYFHKWALRRNEHDNRHLQFAWNKYGEATFQIEVVQLVPAAHLLEVETVYLNEHVGRAECFNLALDATAPMRGRKHSEATKSRMTETRIGKHRSEETCRKIGEAQLGSNHHFFGKHLSEEHRRKIGEAGKGKHPSIETRQKMSETKKRAKRDSLGRFQNGD